MSRMRIGVIGLGFGQYHVRTLANMDGFHLAAVADQLQDLESYAQRYGVRTYRDGLEMLEKEPLDAVSLCVSPRWRLPLVEAAARRGLPMYVEKPWASNLAQAQDLARVCAQHNATVMTGFSFRYLPAITRLRRLIDEELGAPWALSGEYVFDWLPPGQHWLWDPENGNGFFNENSCHLFDAVCTLLGAPLSVMAEAAAFCGSPSEEMATISMRFSGGAIAALIVGTLGAASFRRFPRLNLFTANGQALLEGREHIWESLTWATRQAGAAQTFSTAPEALDNTRYTHAFQHFWDCLQQGKAPELGVADGLRAVAIAEALYASARSGQKVLLADLDWKGASA